MLPLRVTAAVLAGIVVADAPLPLRVIRTTPLSEALPATAITVTFDRPIIGSLDRNVDPRGILVVTPAIPGVLEWRDPVTLRLTPEKTLPAGARYTATVNPTFTALDGARLAEPYRWSFRVTGPAVLTGMPVGPGEAPKFLTPEPTLTLVLSTPVDSDLLTRLVYIELDRSCPLPGTVRLQAGAQAAIPDSASWQFREAGGWDRDRSLDRLRRLVTLKPERPLPLGCSGSLVVPSYVDAESPGEFRRWGFSTYGPFRIAAATCGSRDDRLCPAGPLQLELSTPVKGADLIRHLKVLPPVKLALPDTNEARERWALFADFKPRTGYLIELDPSLTDVFGQRLEGNPRVAVATTGFAPDVSYVGGRLTIERNGPRTLPVTYVNVDTLEVIAAPVPDSMEAALLSRSWYAWNEHWPALAKRAVRRKLPVGAPRDRHGVYGVPFDAPNAARPGTPTLFAVRITSAKLPKRKLETGAEGDQDYQPIALIQVTDLGVHAKIGPEEGVVWVTGASDGKPRPGAAVRIRDAKGRMLAQGTTDQRGLARFGALRRRPQTPSGDDEEGPSSFEGYVDVRLGADRAVLGVNEYDPDLSPWRFNVSSAWGIERLPAAAAVFTERGIYRPGDSVFAKVIVRTGLLGALKVPSRADSVRVVFHDRDEGTLRDSTLVLSAFGTAAPAIALPNDAKLGSYAVAVSLKRLGEWQELARADYRVAEYRPPEFLVDVTADTAARENGDSLTATISARYLFGAPMARARVSWSVRQRTIGPWELTIPNTDGYYVAARGFWWEEFQERTGSAVTESRADSLDGRGQLVVRAPLELANPALPARVSLEALVTDVNRQTSFGSAAVVVHPTSVYIGAKPTGPSYFWNAGQPQTVEIIAVRPDGRRVADLPVGGVLIRREWHQVRRENDGYAELVGEWVSDTVDRCAVRTTTTGVPCRLTPAAAGSYLVAFAAKDTKNRDVSTSFYRWVTGPGWVPWADESQFKMDVIADRTRYQVGDTATVLFASPFTNAEAWVTIEREGLIEQRRLTITDGATTLKLPVTEVWSPNVFLSIVVARGRSGKPGPLDDPGRPTIRVGYAEVRVTPERKRLAVVLTPDQREYRPGDKAVIQAAVRDGAAGRKSEVTLWAVDEGVLALTGYKTPDPIDLLYRPRGLGLRLGSNLSTVAPQVAPGDKGRNPGGGGGEGAAEILRSRFRTTAFFLGSVVTDSSGVGTATVTLPDNLTTFRVMGVAVTAGDRYGSGQSSMLVTRPLLARAALPRFLRPGDRFTAGVVVNHRTGGTPSVRVEAKPNGIALEGAASRSATLEAGRGREVRFDFRGQPGDSAVFRFDVSGAGDRDAVRVAIPVRPAERPRTVTVAGVVRDSTGLTLEVSPDADPARSRITVSLGSSPLALLKGYADDLRVYPYYCSEQVSSVAMPLIALYRARKQAGAGAGDTLRLSAEIQRAVGILARRQRDDGAIGLWSASDWSSPYTTAHAGLVLLDARAAGAPVRDTVLAGIAGYLNTALEREPNLALSVALLDSETRVGLAERVAIAEFLSRAGKRNRPLENELIRRVGQLAPESRMQLAITLARGGDLRTARRLLEPIWQAVKVEGRTAALPDSLRSRFYYPSALRPAANLLLATLAVEPSHPLLGPLLETVVTRGRGLPWWNTQDYAAAVRAVDGWQRRFPAAERPALRILANGRPVFSTAADRVSGDSTVSLSTLLGGRSPGPVALTVRASGAAGLGFFYLTLTEQPRTPPVNPTDQGIRVERWYESYETGKPITSAIEGDLVRVKLRVTVPSERAFVVLDDPLPAGLEAIDLSLRTVGGLPGPGAADSSGQEAEPNSEREPLWAFGTWDSGWWTPFDHRELRDDRVIYSARALWQGSYTASYLTRATTPGTFIKPQTHAEEMYNPAVYGRSDGGVFVVRPKAQ